MRPPTGPLAHPDDCDCGREHAAGLVLGLTRRWGRRRRRNSLLALAATAALLAVAWLAWAA